LIFKREEKMGRPIKFTGEQVVFLKQVVANHGLTIGKKILLDQHGINVSIGTLSKYIKSGSDPIGLRCGPRNPAGGRPRIYSEEHGKLFNLVVTQHGLKKGAKVLSEQHQINIHVSTLRNYIGK
jgi:hypothetical protein